MRKDASELPRALKVREGVAVYRRNRAGSAAKRNKMWERYTDQKGICAKCGQKMDLGDSKLELDEFTTGQANRLVHKTPCKG